jgi:hypothetical protein
MREKQEVLEKFAEMRALKLKERKEGFLNRQPRNCYFNFRQRVRENSIVGFCQNPEVIKTIGTKVFVCNDCETAKRCNSFQCRNTEESVERDFDDVLKSPARCGQEYPKLAILIWFLQDYESQNRWVRLGRLTASIGKGLYKLMFFRWW